jgi:hypothetical protein
LFESIFEALNSAQVRYIVVGGVATVLHASLAGRPISIGSSILSPPKLAKRSRPSPLWVCGPMLRSMQRPSPTGRTHRVDRNQGMRGLSFWDPQVALRDVDVLAESPIAFEELWARSQIVVLSTTSVRVVSIRDRIVLKSIAGRPQDLQDVEALEEILKRQAGDA